MDLFQLFCESRYFVCSCSDSLHLLISQLFCFTDIFADEAVNVYSKTTFDYSLPILGNVLDLGSCFHVGISSDSLHFLTTKHLLLP